MYACITELHPSESCSTQYTALFQWTGPASWSFEKNHGHGHCPCSKCNLLKRDAPPLAAWNDTGQLNFRDALAVWASICSCPLVKMSSVTLMARSLWDSNTPCPTLDQSLGLMLFLISEQVILRLQQVCLCLTEREYCDLARVPNSTKFTIVMFQKVLSLTISRFLSACSLRTFHCGKRWSWLWGPSELLLGLLPLFSLGSLAPGLCCQSHDSTGVACDTGKESCKLQMKNLLTWRGLPGTERASASPWWLCPSHSGGYLCHTQASMELGREQRCGWAQHSSPTSLSTSPWCQLQRASRWLEGVACIRDC